MIKIYNRVEKSLHLYNVSLNGELTQIPANSALSFLADDLIDVIDEALDGSTLHSYRFIEDLLEKIERYYKSKSYSYRKEGD